MPEQTTSFVKTTSLYAAVFLAALLFTVIHYFTLLAPIALSFFLILLIALALNPIVARVRTLGARRGLATAGLALLFLGLVGLTAWAFYSPVKRSASRFFEQMPQYWQRIQQPLQKLERSTAPPAAPAATSPPTSGQTNVIVVTPPKEHGFLQVDGGHAVTSITHSLQSLLSNAAAMALVGVTVFVGVIYTLLNPKPIFTTAFGIIPERHHERASRIARRIVEFVPRWALALLTGMGVIGVMVFLAMWPLFGIQDALVLGLIAFVFEAIPYIGAVIGGIPALLLAFGQGGLTPLWVVISYVGIQLFEHNVVSPVIVAGQLQQHPVAVIFSVLLCIAAFGVLGVLLAVPAVAVLRILHEEIFRPKYLPHSSDERLDELAQDTLAGNANASFTTATKPRRRRFARAEQDEKLVHKTHSIDD